jgi:hypothetical protein
MKTLDKFIKALQSTQRISFRKRTTRATKTKSAQQIQLGGNFYAKDADSILILMNAEENEFLFI